MGNLYNPLADMRIRNDAGLRSVVGATFGPDVRQSANGPKKHQGWDLYAPVGTPVYAIGNGYVVWTKEGGDYGKQILLSFNTSGQDSMSDTSKLYAFYAHLSEISVPEGYVQAGVEIGKAGISGNADAKYPHLHFEVRTSPEKGIVGLDKRINPGDLLGYGMLSCISEEMDGINVVRMSCQAASGPTKISP
jgi:murein DD-endopeptidase MepM/ murein hydrolase activator NlpD